MCQVSDISIPRRRSDSGWYIVWAWVDNYYTNIKFLEKPTKTDALRAFYAKRERELGVVPKTASVIRVH